MARVVAQGDFRPMQGHAEAMDDLNRILDAREPLYRKADVTLDTSGESAGAKPRRSCARPSRPEPTTAQRRIAWHPRTHPPATSAAIEPTRFVTYDTHPGSLRALEARVRRARSRRSTLDVDEDRGIRPGYKLKLNSYDLGVDIELADALQRIRFEHPEVRSVDRHERRRPRSSAPAPTSSCSGTSSHAWKVNFCKFTNETRNGIEDSSRHSGLKFIAACNGTTAGGGYELALACDEILLIDDRSSAVSLPEVPLLGVLPGTGGLTRLTDKRHVRRDHADIFCTLVEGVRAPRAQGMAADRRSREAAAVRGKR